MTEFCRTAVAFALIWGIIQLSATAQPYQFGHLKEVVLPEEAEAMVTLQYAKGNIYFAPFFRPQVAIFDVDAERIEKTVGRRGGGPGEFDVPTVSIMATNDRLIVGAGPALHLFGLDGTFQKKVVTKLNYILLNAIGLSNGEYLFSTRAVRMSPETNQPTLKSALGVFDSNSGEAIDFSRFGEGFASEYPELEQFVIGSNSKMAAYVQSGGNTVTFASHEGRPLKTVRLTADPSAIRFVKPHELEPGSTLGEAASKGGNPNRLFPSHLLVRHLGMTEDFTVIFGTFDTAEGRRNISVVDHKTWGVTYHQIPYDCRGMAVDGNRLICLTKEADGRHIQVLQIHKN